MARARGAGLGVLAASGLALALPAPAAAVVELRFATAPTLPVLPSVSLNAQAQTVQAKMTGFAIEDTRLTKSGWNMTVQGQAGSGASPVFAEYCPKAKCGASSEGYVGGGQTLAADSLTLNTAGASFTGGLGTAPALQCGAGCTVDHASAVKIASAPSGVPASEGTWTAGGFSGSSLSLATLTTLRALPNEEIYRVNILWTLSSGP